MRRVLPILSQVMMISSCRDERFQEDQGIELFFVEQSLVRG